MKSMNKNVRGQAGVVSLMVTMIMMIVISLLVLGFAELSRNEQRNTLDQQLSTQAYYAAESGVNDTRQAINAMIAAGQAVQSKTSCGNQGGYTLSGVVDATHNVSYTCVLVDVAPATLVYNVGYTSTVVPIASSGGAIGALTLSWQLPAGTTGGSAAGCYTNIGSLGQFPITTGAGQWNCDYPVVRIDLLDATGGFARASWNSNTATAFLVPFNSNTVNNNTTLAARGAVVPARCTAVTCTANITGMGGTGYYMRVTTLYRSDSRLSISANGVRFAGAEATIDATGRAQDVLRRILVAVDLTGANAHQIPSEALIAEDSVCKRFGVSNGYFSVYDDMSVGGTNIPLCNLQTVGSPQP